MNRILAQATLALCTIHIVLYVRNWETWILFAGILGMGSWIIYEVRNK